MSGGCTGCNSTPCICGELLAARTATLTSKTEVAILQASPDYPIKAGRWVDAKDYETLDRSLRESWDSEKRLAAERDRLRAVLQTVRDRFWLESFDGKEPDAGEFGHQIDVLLGRSAAAPESRDG